MNKDYAQELMHLLLDMGEKILRCGGEVNRCEDTLRRIGRAYGIKEMNVFVITSSIVLTLVWEDGTMMTHSRRIAEAAGNNFRALEQLNALSVSCCKKSESGKATLKELRDGLAAIEMQADHRTFVIGSMIASGSFAIFFGGNLLDCVFAAAFAVLICYFQEKIAARWENTIVFNLSTAFAIGILICVFGKCCPLLHIDKIMIGDIMLLIPGIAITNSMRDLLMGDTISGAMRLIESVLWAGALAFGFMASMWMMGV